MTDINYISKGNKGGTVLGMWTSSLVGFYGTQPVDQPASIACTGDYVLMTGTPATDACTQLIFISSTASSSGCGFSTSAEFGAFVMNIIRVQQKLGGVETALKDVGLIAGGTSVVTATAQPFDYVGTGGRYSDGQCLGQYTSSKIGFFGVVPCDQPTALSTCESTAYASLSTSMVLTTASVIANGLCTISLATSVTVGLGWGNDETGNTVNNMVCVLRNIQDRINELETNLTEVGILPGATALTDADYDYLDKGSDTGTIMGANAESKIAFWGGTPVKQATLTSAFLTLVYSTLALPDYAVASGVNTSACFGAINITQASVLALSLVNVQERLNQIENHLNNLGLQAAS